MRWFSNKCLLIQTCFLVCFLIYWPFKILYSIDVMLAVSRCLRGLNILHVKDDGNLSEWYSSDFPQHPWQKRLRNWSARRRECAGWPDMLFECDWTLEQWPKERPGHQDLKRNKDKKRNIGKLLNIKRIKHTSLQKKSCIKKHLGSTSQWIFLV